MFSLPCLPSRIIRRNYFDGQTIFRQRCGKFGFAGVLGFFFPVILFGKCSAMPNKCRTDFCRILSRLFRRRPHSRSHHRIRKTVRATLPLRAHQERSLPCRRLKIQRSRGARSDGIWPLQNSGSYRLQQAREHFGDIPHVVERKQVRDVIDAC